MTEPRMRNRIDTRIQSHGEKHFFLYGVYQASGSLLYDQCLSAASLMHKSKEKALEDRLVPEEIEARALRKKVAQVMMTVRATLRPWALLVLGRRGSVLTALRLGLMAQISAV